MSSNLSFETQSLTLYSDIIATRPWGNVKLLKSDIEKYTTQLTLFLCTGAPPTMLFFGPGKMYHVMGKTMLKKE